MLAAAFMAGAGATLLLIPAGTSAQALTPPQVTNQPTVEGTAAAGRTLFTTNGSWSGTSPMSFRYRWLRCDTSGGGTNGVNCATIPGETRRTYVLRNADVGHRIRSRVIATNADGTDSFNSNATAVIRSAPSRPSNGQVPTISGSPVENQTLTASAGSWTGNAPIAYAYQWRRCDRNGTSCSAISGATQKTYALKSVDVGATIRVRVTAKNGAGSGSASSAPTAVVTKAGAPSGSAISIDDVALPNRLLIARVSFSPYILRSRQRVVARFRVTDSQNHPVQGALVFAVAIPFGNMTTPPEQATGPDGYVTFVFRPTARLKVGGRGSQPFMVRARKSGERLIGGVSTRRLVNLSIR